MAQEKAYKVLAQQKKISNKKAKELIDRGLVFVGDKQIKIARAELSTDTKFRIEYPSDIEIIYEDEEMVAVNKPAQVDSYDIQDAIEGAELLHRLDRDTSGVLLLGRSEAFIKKAVNAFKNRRVEKEYVAWVEGVVCETMVIDDPIYTIKKGKAFSRIDPVRGKKAHTVVKPEEVQGKKSKVYVEITTGRTHQIRVHLAHAGYPIVGDIQYGSRTQSKRILLHSARMVLLGMTFEAPEPQDIVRYK
ncbi:MAG: RluA family pseudouridine synthase [Sulfurovum sp.]|nr:RluA family pseudouridine synthase [Sulfurovum sp.]MCB4746536.1 RluA family pseudouridine synthase [Sulfurovum sp.]MCB4748813.1 RluA family pseudouridine synthase [Sulfurovum sp.]MCB4764725.1 RluA family pseudouridine synthase [Sulfurovum sp.]MCB4774898.1 RluA family pseudouridine synthase [Sulfurovum sp.]